MSQLAAAAHACTKVILWNLLAKRAFFRAWPDNSTVSSLQIYSGHDLGVTADVAARALASLAELTYYAKPWDLGWRGREELFAALAARVARGESRLRRITVLG